MIIVADTSVILAVVMNEPEKAWVIESTSASEAIAPASLPFEIANAISRLVRRRRLAADRAQAAWQAASSLAVALKAIDIAGALRLVCHRQIYAYDAFMLQCALENAAPLLTLDRKMRAVARDLGIAVLE